MNFEALLQQVCSYQGWGWASSGDGGYSVEVPTEYGRSQVVQISPSQDPDGRAMAIIWSVVCDVSSISDPYYLLRLNCEMSYGALAVQDPNVILIETQLIETAEPEEIMRAVFYVATNADSLEQQVYGNVDHS